ncbi:DNA-binding response regulator, NarL/FixJ family, contains REC and HTH domains [Saccharicrinis carchari]|uniref:DNA-binding response regulator, NarL/FixJ family, contains REC and HTH domains n=1 Tax=Saccharicrinis carchari TaxID=1168039 RepID=A0A521DZ00_SACCC|nr:LuxR family transcriptional regulator [Saccharicrinis carchari]SMO76842.1 DNA-binding response regulator, NarL/FixJ family, contains REC and HTH domains [Saccharicrinis carchari]
MQVEPNEAKKIKIAIAAKQFLYRLGIKTIISVIGVEPELYETNDYDNITQCLKHHPDIEYLIINQDILPLAKEKSLQSLKELCPCGKLMVIGDASMKHCSCASFMHNIDNQKDVLEKFQEFFFEPDKNPIEHENTTLLSDREIEVLTAVAMGYSNKEIAEKLFISSNTVITHRKNITEKLGIKTIAGLTVYAIINNLIDPETVKSK